MGLLIKNGKVFSEGRFIDAEILVKGSKIAEIGKSIKSKAKIFDVSGRYILPGLIDIHVHFRDFGQEYKEDWASGSMAAAAGGITTVLDMPNNINPIISKKLLNEKLKHAAKNSLVNFGAYIAVTDKNIKEINKSRSKFVKLYYGETTGKIIPGDADKIFREINEDILIVAHAEDNNIINENKRKYSSGSPIYHSLIRDNRAEYTAVHDLIKLSSKYNKRLHITHVSAKESLLLIKQAKNRGIKITCDTCPHYLFLNNSLYGKIGNMAKVNPALKLKPDNDALWKYLNDGTIDLICSDHAPHSIEEKKRDYEHAPSGFPGVETMLQLMLTAVNEKKITIEKLIRLMAENPARIFGLNNKGAIKAGDDADLIIIDLQNQNIINGREQFTKAKWTPFEGFVTKGKAITSIINGNVVYNEKRINVDKKGKEIKISVK